MYPETSFSSPPARIITIKFIITYITPETSGFLEEKWTEEIHTNINPEEKISNDKFHFYHLQAI